MAAAACADDRVSYNVNVVRDLEQSMTQLMPKTWIEDMMFLKANNVCAPTGLIPKRKTKEIQLHYGTKEEDEWKGGDRMANIKETIGGLVRKLGETNFDSVFEKIASRCRSDDDSSSKLQEVVDNMLSIVSSQTFCHPVMIRLVRQLRATNPSFGYPVCSGIDNPSLMTGEYVMWTHACYQNEVIDKDSYIKTCEKLMDHYSTLDQDQQSSWADSFVYALKHKVNDEWWRPRLQALIDDPKTPLALCFKIEDYFEE